MELNNFDLNKIITEKHFKISGLELNDIHSDFFIDFKYYVNAIDIINIEQAPDEFKEGVKYLLNNYVLTVKVWQNNGRYNVRFIDDFVNLEPTYYTEEIKFIKSRCEKTIDYNSYEIWKTIRDEIQKQIDFDPPYIDF